MRRAKKAACTHITGTLDRRITAYFVCNTADYGHTILDVLIDPASAAIAWFTIRPNLPLMELTYSLAMVDTHTHGEV